MDQERGDSQWRAQLEDRLRAGTEKMDDTHSAVEQLRKDFHDARTRDEERWAELREVLAAVRTVSWIKRAGMFTAKLCAEILSSFAKFAGPIVSVIAGVMAILHYLSQRQLGG